MKTLRERLANVDINAIKDKKYGEIAEYLALNPNIQPTLATIPSNFKYAFILSKKRKLSPLKAIRAKCIECVNYEESQSRIKECTVIRCPLHAYRPYQD